jgi:hypothetical protein
VTECKIEDNINDASPVKSEEWSNIRRKESSMKMTTTVKWAAALVMAASLTAYAQDTNGAAGGGSGGQGEVTGQHPHPTPEQLAQRLMSKFDANKDGKLSQDELTKAMEDLHSHRPQQGTGDGQQAGQNGQPTATPPADKVAAQWIEKFSSDKTGLTQAELVKALEARHANRSHHGEGQQGGGQPGGTNNTSAASN